MESERYNRVVHDHNVFQITVCNYSKIFDKHTRGRLHAVVAIKSVADNLIVLVDEIKNGVCIVLFARCKHTDFEQR